MYDIYSDTNRFSYIRDTRETQHSTTQGQTVHVDFKFSLKLLPKKLFFDHVPPPYFRKRMLYSLVKKLGFSFRKKTDLFDLESFLYPYFHILVI